MRRLPALIVLALALVALAIPALGASASARTGATSPAATASAAKGKACAATFTEGRAARSLRVSGVTCAQGRAIAGRVSGAAPAGCVKFVDKKGHVKLTAPCAYKGFGCTARRISNGLALSVTCRKGGKAVRFQY